MRRGDIRSDGGSDMEVIVVEVREMVIVGFMAVIRREVVVMWLTLTIMTMKVEVIVTMARCQDVGFHNSEDDGIGNGGSDAGRSNDRRNMISMGILLKIIRQPRMYGI